MVTFYDQNGLGYVPAGVVATIYPLGAAQLAANVIASGMVGTSGAFLPTLPAGQHFYAIFAGEPTHTPQYPAQFATPQDGSNASVSVPFFGSPVQSAAGYAYQLRNVHYPHRWLDDEELTPIANAWFAGIGGGLADLDLSTQTLRTAMRLESSTGNYLDSFARDLFGTLLPRIAGETDSLYLARLLVFTSRLRMTLGCIAAVVQTYLASIVNLPHGGAGLGLDSTGGIDSNAGATDTVPPTDTTGIGSGNNLGLDSQEGSVDSGRGALDNTNLPTYAPTVIIFDVQSDPVSAAAVSLQDGQVCIYFKYQGYNNPPQVMGSPDPLLIYLVNIVKRCGTGVVYITNKY